ncbi:MAG TPA: hypothetical protein VE575_17495 [Acidimicrobiales bacterium]|nr:hypothetical protein [Acidimicrobiales bacterium]
MSMHVKVSLDGEGPVVVKTATGDDDRTRLRLEGERLAQARHPGLVSVVLARNGEEAELRTRYAGDPVSHWTGPVASIAGLGAAVAATLGDLHEIGVVHGRLDSTHILVGPDGRPRLCGLSHPGGPAAPADDVAALGRVLAELLERAPAERRGPRRWPRTDAAGRRALERVIARALDPLPSRRPHARLLASSILDAVPAAELPAPPASPGAGDETGEGEPTGGGEPTGEGGDDLLDVVLTHEMSDDERWAEACGDAPAGRRASRVGLAALTILMAAAVAVAVVVSDWGRAPGSAAPAEQPPEPALAPGCAAVKAPAADVDGDGCAEALTIDGATITAGTARWTLGKPGDVVTVGDWACDGRGAPALLRPATGDVFVFPTWAEAGQPLTVEAHDRLPGAVAIRSQPGDDGCDRLAVELASGATTVVAVSRP